MRSFFGLLAWLNFVFYAIVIIAHWGWDFPMDQHPFYAGMLCLIASYVIKKDA